MSDPPRLVISIDDYELSNGSSLVNEQVELQKMDAILDAHLIRKQDSTGSGPESDSGASSTTLMMIPTTSGIMKSSTSGPLSFSFDYLRERRELKERYDTFKRDLEILMKREAELRHNPEHQASLAAINQRIAAIRDQMSVNHYLLRRVRYMSVEEMQWTWDTFEVDFKCSICLDTMTECRAVLGCLHRFCKICLDTIFNRIHGKEIGARGHRCPACNSHMPSKRHAREDLRYDQLIALTKSLNLDVQTLQELDTATLQRLHEERIKKIQERAAGKRGSPRASASSSRHRNFKQTYDYSINGSKKIGRQPGSTKENIRSGTYQTKKSGGSKGKSSNSEGEREEALIALSLKPLNLVQRNGEYMLNLGPGYMSILPGGSGSHGGSSSHGTSDSSSSTDKDKMDIDGQPHGNNSSHLQLCEERLIVLKTPEQMETFVSVYNQYLCSNPRPVPPDLLLQQEANDMDIENNNDKNGKQEEAAEPVCLEEVVISAYEIGQCQKHPNFAQALLQYYRDEITKVLANKAMLKPYICVPVDTTVEYLKAYVNRRKAYEESSIASVTHISLEVNEAKSSDRKAASLNELVYVNEEKSSTSNNSSGIKPYLNLGTMNSQFPRAYDIYFFGKSHGKLVKLIHEQSCQDVMLSMWEEGEVEFFFWWRPSDTAASGGSTASTTTNSS